MRLNAPKQGTWWIAFIIGAVGIIANYVNLPFLSGSAFLLVVIGFVLLVLATVFRGL